METRVNSGVCTLRSGNRFPDTGLLARRMSGQETTGGAVDFMKMATSDGVCT